ncbi:SMP-30/gluconolactonase/LRE family protein [Antrihabitans cavernicola]|uniref:SMP-30/gluconolactonase/LRE family protein n=1 Tax=Antrihabitans cavernicola TaxID=2495913 RepID=A0A5A7S3D3_9NOCA|nr:SMP-30/gluconolactonase/LRE family protein [Spelaeibacter cavernicola]KAA0018087.1 SMP-30/gluconolactonase/LRE family protein [Spelaeibacter cavernicola]
MSKIPIRPLTILVALVAAGLFAPASAAAQPVSCSPASVTTAIPTSSLMDWSENLTYDRQGNLWVSRISRDRVVRYDPSGHVTASVPIDAPGALRVGPDGLMYAVTGNRTFNIVTHQPSGVVRFDPTAPAPVPRPVVSGQGIANGAAFDSAGNLYVADELAGIFRVLPNGTIDRAWSDQAKLFGVNGVAVLGDDVITSVISSMTGEVYRIPIGAPSSKSVLAQLTPAVLPVPTLPDDMAVAPDGMLYVTTAVGRLVRVDPSDGSTCTVVVGEPMTSAVFTPGSDKEMLVGTESGRVLRVVLN